MGEAKPLFKVFNYDVNIGLLASFIYSFVSLILFLIVCVLGWRKVKTLQKTKEEEKKCCNCKIFRSWITTVWKMKSIYLSALVHIYDIGTDVGIIVDWGLQMNQENNGGPKHDVRGIDMEGLFAASILAFFLYRFISAYFVYEFTGKLSRACIQWFDLEIYRAIYITHTLEREEAGNLQRWLQKFEAIFESALQSLLQLVYIVKTGDYHPLIMSSIILSFFSVAARFTSDDRIFFNENAQSIGFKCTLFKGKKCCSKSTVADDPETVPKKTSTEIMTEPDSSHSDSEQTNYDLAVAVVNDEDEKHGLTNHDTKQAKDHPNAEDEDLKEENASGWKCIDFNRAYLFRYSFRMCDVFSRLMILSLVWCALNGTTTFFILLIEVITVVRHAVHIRKYNFFQFLVATYFSEDNRKETISYCFVRRMESLIYLVVVSSVVLFGDKYNDDDIVYCHLKACNEVDWRLHADTLGLKSTFPGSCLDSTSHNLCDLATNYDRTVCDCSLDQEVLATKILLIAAWALANLSGSLFFGAFNNMAKKFGTNERHIMSVMEKRDWSAFREMLQFEYKMDKIDKNTKHSALTTFLDRVSSDEFKAADVDDMIKLGAKINDRSKSPTNDQDKEDKDKIGDNVLIRYIKVTPCHEIDKEFKKVVEKWTIEDGIEINTANESGYTAFKVYWEKMQYERRLKQRERREIMYRKKCRRIEHEDTEHNAPKLEDEERQNDEWFATFYQNIREWKTLKADMRTVSEDHISPLLAYIQDTQIRPHAQEDSKADTRYINMDIVKELCPTMNEEDQKYENDLENTNPNHDHLKTLTQQIKNKAFVMWIKKYDEINAVVPVNDIATWHTLGCTGNIRKMNLLSTHLMRCDEPKIDDIDTLISTLKDCDCGPENEKTVQNPSLRPLPMTNVIDHSLGLSKSKLQLFDDALGRWYARHGLQYYDAAGNSLFFKYIQILGKFDSIEEAKKTNLDYDEVEDIIDEAPADAKIMSLISQVASEPYAVIEECWDAEHYEQVTAPIKLHIWKHIQGKFDLKPERTDFEGVYDIDRYSTRLQHIIETHRILSVEDINDLIGAGYLLRHEGSNIQAVLRKAVRNPDLSFDVFEYLINKVMRISEEEEKKDPIVLDHVIFNEWIKNNTHITFERIERLIEEYKFSPYLSDSEQCAVHYIWQNTHADMNVCHRFWEKVIKERPNQFVDLYQSFLFEVMEHRNLRQKQIETTDSKDDAKDDGKTYIDISEIERIFEDQIETTDKETGNNIIHYYCKNKNVNIQILKYMCTQYKALLHQRNKQDHHALHLLCQNTSVKMEFLRYFDTLGVPMDTQTHAGWQPFQALHYLFDNPAVIWQVEHVKIMIHDLKIDFITRRAGESILFRLSHQCNFTTQALIYLYRHYKKIIDLNSLKSPKTMYSDTASRGGKTILANLVSRALEITPKQIKTLVKEIELDITAKDRDNKSVLHFASNRHLTALKLQRIGELLKDKQSDQFVVADSKGTTPFQQWLHAVGKHVAQHMDVVEVWESLGSDITQLDNTTSYNMLHYYLKNSVWNIHLAHIRKMCFDEENPWKSHEKRAEKKDRKKVGQFQIPMHVRPIPDNKTLPLLYTQSAQARNEQINSEVFTYFNSKDGIRFDLEAPGNVLWAYLATTDVNVETLQFLIDKMGFQYASQGQDNAVLQYMKHQDTRDKINWDVLDYFYHLKQPTVDFKQKQDEYMTILHLYALHATPFNCDEFNDLIKQYDLDEILETKSANPTAAGLFYERRRSSITPHIIECFANYFNINDPVNKMTPIHYYCDLTDSHYIKPSIIKSFVKYDAVLHGQFVEPKQYNSVCQIIANSRPDYNHLKTLEMMMDLFKHEKQLEMPQNRMQSLWYTFLKSYADRIDLKEWDGFFEKFMTLTQIYTEAGVEPKTLLHDDDIDGEKKHKYKIYQIDDLKTEDQLTLANNKKNVTKAKKYVGRIVFVRDERDGVFRSCMTIDPHSGSDWMVKIPQIWLKPIKWKQLQMQIETLSTIHHVFTKSLALARSHVFIDLELVNKIESWLRSTRGSTSEMMNHLLFSSPKGSQDENILLKYLRCNHESRIFADDINQFAKFKIDFKFGYGKCNHALITYCKYSDGEIDDSIVKALKKGGCPMNWDDENEDGIVVKTEFTPLQVYAKLPNSNLSSFRKLVECGGDVLIESAQNCNAVYYLLRYSENVEPAFIHYLWKDLEYKFGQPLVAAYSDTLLLNVYLRFNPNIREDTIGALVDAGCDPNSRDGVSDTNSIKSYLNNKNIDKFSMNIIRELVKLGADINEADDGGAYPIQHLLLMEYTPLKKVMEHVREMIKLHAMLDHILCDNDTTIQDRKLYKLQDMKDGYEHHNNSWCTVKTKHWTYWGQSKSVQLAVALDESRSNETLGIDILRANLIDISEKELLDLFDEYSLQLGQGDEDDSGHDVHDDNNVEEDEHKVSERDGDYDDDNKVEEEEPPEEYHD